MEETTGHRASAKKRRFFFDVSCSLRSGTGFIKHKEIEMKMKSKGSVNTHRPAVGHRSLGGRVMGDRRLRRLKTRAAGKMAALAQY